MQAINISNNSKSIIAISLDINVSLYLYDYLTKYATKLGSFYSFSCIGIFGYCYFSVYIFD